MMTARFVVIKHQDRDRRFHFHRKLGGSGGIKLWLVPDGLHIKTRWWSDLPRSTLLPKVNKRPL